MFTNALLVIKIAVTFKFIILWYLEFLEPYKHILFYDKRLKFKRLFFVFQFDWPTCSPLQLHFSFFQFDWPGSSQTYPQDHSLLCFLTSFFSLVVPVLWNQASRQLQQLKTTTGLFYTLAGPTNGKLAPKFWVYGPKFRIGYIIVVNFQKFLQIYLVLFDLEPWVQVQSYENKKAIKLRHTWFNTKPAL